MKIFIARCRLLAVAASTYVLQQNLTRDSRAALAAVRLKERNAETEKQMFENRMIENKNKIEIKAKIIEMIEMINMEFEDIRSTVHKQKNQNQRKEKIARMTADSICQKTIISWNPGSRSSEDYSKYENGDSSDKLKLMIDNNSNNNNNNNNNDKINNNDINNNNDNNDNNNNNNNNVTKSNGSSTANSPISRHLLNLNLNKKKSSDDINFDLKSFLQNHDPDVSTDQQNSTCLKNIFSQLKNMDLVGVDKRIDENLKNKNEIFDYGNNLVKKYKINRSLEIAEIDADASVIIKNKEEIMREKYREFSQRVRSKVHEITQNDDNTNKDEKDEKEKNTTEEKNEFEATNRISKLIGYSKIPIIYDPNNHLKNTFTSDYRKDFAIKNIRRKAKEVVAHKMTEKREKNSVKNEEKMNISTDLGNNSTNSTNLHNGINKKKKKKKILKCDQDFLYNSIDEFSYENLYKRYTRGKVRPTQPQIDPTQHHTDRTVTYRNVVVETNDFDCTQDGIPILPSTVPIINGAHTEGKSPYNDDDNDDELNYESLYDTTYDSKYDTQYDNNSSLPHDTSIDEKEETYVLSENAVHSSFKTTRSPETKRNIVTFRYGRKIVRESSTDN